MGLKRRDFLMTAGGMAAGISATAGVVTMPRVAHAHDPRNPPPNIVFILSDDQGWDDYGFMGHPHIRTPNLDRLAAESVVFTRGYVAAPVCCPSLASIITGLEPHQHKITSNDPPAVPEGGWPPERQDRRREFIAHIDEVATMPSLLGRRGYVSLQTGKWWLGHYRRGGFTHGMTHGEFTRGGRHGDEGLAIGRETMQPIADFLDEAGDLPFFMWYAPMMPHLPHNPPERLLDHYRDKTDSIHVARYWAMCEWWDETCGELIDMLEQRGLRENTIIAYVCDNGWTQLPDKPLMDSRSKMTAYEGGIRTPIMINWPGRLAPRMDEATPVSSLDIAPTCLRMAGFEPTAEMPGLDLRDRKALDAREFLCGAQYGHNFTDIQNPAANVVRMWAIEDGWKLILTVWPGSNQPPELYHIADDPREQHDLADAHPERVAALTERIKAWWPRRYHSVFEGAATESVAGWQSGRPDTCVIYAADGALVVESTANDPFITCGQVPRRTGPFRLELRMRADSSGNGQVFWLEGAMPTWAEGRSLLYDVTHDNQWRTVTLELSVERELRGLRIDPMTGAGRADIDSIRLLDAAGREVAAWTFDD